MKTIINGKGIIEYDSNQKFDWSVEVRFDMSRLTPEQQLTAWAIIEKHKDTPLLPQWEMLNELSHNGFGGEIQRGVGFEPMTIKLRSKTSNLE